VEQRRRLDSCRQLREEASGLELRGSDGLGCSRTAECADLIEETLGEAVFDGGFLADFHLDFGLSGLGGNGRLRDLGLGYGRFFEANRLEVDHGRSDVGHGDGWTGHGKRRICTVEDGVGEPEGLRELAEALANAGNGVLEVERIGNANPGARTAEVKLAGTEDDAGEGSLFDEGHLGERIDVSGLAGFAERTDESFGHALAAAAEIEAQAATHGAPLSGENVTPLCNGGAINFTKMYLSGAIGLTVLALGVYQIIGILRSPTVTVDGEISGLFQSHGREPSSNFHVLNNTPIPDRQLSTDYAGSKLFNGEWVHVQYLAFNGDVTLLQTFQGNTVTWTLQEGNGTITSIIICLFGAFFLVVFVMTITRPQRPEDLSPEDLDAIDPDGPDDASMLHLSDKE